MKSDSIEIRNTKAVKMNISVKSQGTHQKNDIKYIHKNWREE